MNEYTLHVLVRVPPDVRTQYTYDIHVHLRLNLAPENYFSFFHRRLILKAYRLRALSSDPDSKGPDVIDNYRL